MEISLQSNQLEEEKRELLGSVLNVAVEKNPEKLPKQNVLDPYRP